MRLALISLHTSPADLPGSGDAGGMNVVERAQAEALARLGHTVELITRRSDPDSPDIVELSPGVTLRHLTAGPARPIPKSQQEALIGRFGARLAELERYDLVHSHHWMSGVAALPVARRWGVPHVQSFHSVAAQPGSPLADGERPESPGRIAGEAMVASRSDLVITVSEYEAGIAIDRCGADPARVEVVLPGVDSELFHPDRGGGSTDALGSQSLTDNGYLAFAARLQPLKGADLAVSALARVPVELRPELVIAGEPSADFPDYGIELDRLIADNRLDQQVTFLGPQSRADLARLLRGARMVLMPSHSETFGLIALEAAASGVPVIASAAGGLTELVVDRVTGRLMPDRDPEHWAAAITELLTDPEVADRMGRDARRHAEQFSWDRAARRLADLYAGLGPQPLALREG